MKFRKFVGTVSFLAGIILSNLITVIGHGDENDTHTTDEMGSSPDFGLILIVFAIFLVFSGGLYVYLKFSQSITSKASQ